MKTPSLQGLGLAISILATCLPTSGQADTIYLCKAYSGGTFWTNGTCASRNAHIERIANVPGNMPFEQQVDIASGQKAAAEAHGTTTTVTTTYSNASTSPQVEKKTACDALNAQVTRYDAMARQPQSGQMQDWITGERKKVRDKQYALRC